jgi:hypothetical protein
MFFKAWIRIDFFFCILCCPCSGMTPIPLVPSIIIEMSISKLILDSCKSAEPWTKKTKKRSNCTPIWQGQKQLNTATWIRTCFGFMDSARICHVGPKEEDRCLGDFHLEASRSIVLEVCMCSVLVWVAYFLFGCSTSPLLAVIDVTETRLVGNTTTRMRGGRESQTPTTYSRIFIPLKHIHSRVQSLKSIKSCSSQQVQHFFEHRGGHLVCLLEDVLLVWTWLHV